MNYILIGMAGCGKSCMGRAVAKKTKMKSVDVDKLIEEKYGKRLSQIISEVGVEKFKEIEESTLLTLNYKDTIISTGGSAIYYPKAMEHLKSIGTVVYIYTSLSVLLERIGDFKKRGMVMKEGQTIEDLYLERKHLYEKYADITLNCNGNDYESYQDDFAEIIFRNKKN